MRKSLFSEPPRERQTLLLLGEVGAVEAAHYEIFFPVLLVPQRQPTVDGMRATAFPTFRQQTDIHVRKYAYVLFLCLPQW